MIMKLIIILMVTSCTTRTIVKEIERQPIARSDKYLSCILKLNEQGIKQSLIETLCNSTYGGIND